MCLYTRWSFSHVSHGTVVDTRSAGEYVSALLGGVSAVSRVRARRVLNSVQECGYRRPGRCLNPSVVLGRALGHRRRMLGVLPERV